MTDVNLQCLTTVVTALSLTSLRTDPPYTLYLSQLVIISFLTSKRYSNIDMRHPPSTS